MSQATQWQGVVPKVILCCTLISACKKDKQPEQTSEMFQAMQWQGVVPGVATYSALIRCGNLRRPDQRLREGRAA